MEEHIAELVSINTAMLETLTRIEYYTAILAVSMGMGLGLVIWRLILLSKNQRSLF
jgi:hypothetical protein